MISNELLVRVQHLTEQRQPFVVATVVRARKPTSVRPGDTALVLADGTIEGFVGGVCAASSVRLQSLRAMEIGEPLLLRLVPGDSEGGVEESGGPGERGPAKGDPGEGGLAGLLEDAVVEHNPCLSGGALEIFLEPHLPAARLLVVGETPIAQALKRVAQAAGYDCQLLAAGDASVAEELVAGTAAVIVASHGRSELEVLAAALNAGVPYVALVASVRRGSAVRDELEVPEQLRDQVHTPAGLDIGARSPAEIAISVLAELIAEQRSHPSAERSTESESAIAVATDPMCGMTVAVTQSTPKLQVGGEPVYFCCEGCRDGYAREHSDAVAAG